MPRKLILIRKGFDGSADGKSSPAMDNMFVSLPISSADSGFFYKDNECCIYKKKEQMNVLNGMDPAFFEILQEGMAEYNDTLKGLKDR